MSDCKVTIILTRNDSYNIVDFLGGGSMFDINSLKNIEGTVGHHHHGIDSIFLREGNLNLNKNEFECAVG